MTARKPKIQKTNGICSLCGGVYGKTAMKNHLVRCSQKYPVRKPSGFSVPIQTRLFTILVKGSFLHEYWMYLCSHSGEGLVCEICAPDHECGEDVLLPVVNSPRVGVCGYSGVD